MKTIALVTALAFVTVVPAAAKTIEAAPHRHPLHRAVNPHAFVVPDIGGVYVDGREIGRDPDPNVRAFLRDEYYDMQGGG